MIGLILFNNMKIKFLQTDSGFVSLFTVLLVSVLLAMAVGIATIASKQATLSTFASDGSRAFYVADSAVECLLYYAVNPDTAGVNIFSGGPVTIQCEETGEAVDILALYDATAATMSLTSNAIQDNNTLIPLLNGCAVMSLNRPTIGAIQYTVIEARGYNVTCDQIETSPLVVERAVRVTF